MGGRHRPKLRAGASVSATTESISRSCSRARRWASSGGARVRVTVLALSFVASWFCFVPPYYPLRLEGSGFVALLVFTLFGGAIVAIAHEPNVTVERLLAERRRSEILLAQSTRAEQKLAQLNRELLHRIRNIFRLATSIASQSSQHALTPGEMASALTSRFQALAVAQELLVTNELSGADLRQLAADTLTPLTPKPDADADWSVISANARIRDHSLSCPPRTCH